MAFWILIGLLPSLVSTGCATRKAAQEADNPFLPVIGGPIIGSDWLLVELRIPEGVIDLNRPQLEAEGMGDVYSLRFEGENQIYGKAAPNRYVAVCSWVDESTLEIGPIAVTRILAFQEPEALKEHEFFDYLTQVRRCVITPEDRLELFAVDTMNVLKAVLVFIRQPVADWGQE